MILVVWMAFFVSLVCAWDALAQDLRERRPTRVLATRAVVFGALLAAFTAITIALGLHDLV